MIKQHEDRRWKLLWFLVVVHLKLLSPERVVVSPDNVLTEHPAGRPDCEQNEGSHGGKRPDPRLDWTDVGEVSEDAGTSVSAGFLHSS